MLSPMHSILSHTGAELGSHALFSVSSRSVHMVADGVENFETAVDVCVWQDGRGKLFLWEHPLSTAGD